MASTKTPRRFWYFATHKPTTVPGGRVKESTGIVHISSTGWFYMPQVGQRVFGASWLPVAAADIVLAGSFA